MNLNIEKFNDWARYVYSEQISYFEIGQSDDRSFMECLIRSIDSNINETLVSTNFDFKEADRLLSIGINESIQLDNIEHLNEKFEKIKDSIRKTIDNAGKTINKGIQIGADIYTSVKNIGENIKLVIEKLFTKLKMFLAELWKQFKNRGLETIKKVKSFVKEEMKDNLSSTLSSVLMQKGTIGEIDEAPKDIKNAVSKLKGGISYDKIKSEEALKDATVEIKNSDSADIDDVVISKLVLSETIVNNFLISLKGLILEKYSIDDVVNFVSEKEDQVDKVKKKGLLAWLIEAMGFLLNPIVKCTEFGIKTGVNGSMTILSSIARGGPSKAYKYVALGTICALVYHIVHGTDNILSHFHKEAESGVEVLKTIDAHVNSSLVDKIVPILEKIFGKIFISAMKVYLPIITVIIEMCVIAIASVEFVLSFCELSSDISKLEVCSVALKGEHRVADLFS